MNNHGINTVRALKANTITSRLNLRNSPFVRLHPTDLFVPHRNPSRRADPSVSFHVLFLSNGKTEHSSEDPFSKNKFTVDHENAEKSKCFN